MAFEQKRTYRGAGRIAFLARVDDMKELMKAGYPMLAIYEGYQSELKISYSQFARYVSRYIKRQEKEESKLKIKKDGEEKSVKPEASKKVKFGEDKTIDIKDLI